MIDHQGSRQNQTVMLEKTLTREVGEIDGQACPRGKDWHGRNHGSMIVRTVSRLACRRFMTEREKQPQVSNPPWRVRPAVGSRRGGARADSRRAELVFG